MAGVAVILVAGVSDGAGTTFVRDFYVDAIIRSGGMPLVAPPGLHAAGLVDPALELADALLVPGGRDIDTTRLGLGPMHPAAHPGPATQQDADVALLRAALDQDLPVLGICYGMQLLACLTGGKLHQHLPDDVPGADRHFHQIHDGLVDHDINLSSDSRLSAALDARHVRVNSGHHQAVASVGSGWSVTARAPDGIVEAIESDRHRFAVGVQWHPERLTPAGAHDGIVRALVTATQQ